MIDGNNIDKWNKLPHQSKMKKAPPLEPLFMPAHKISHEIPSARLKR